jgi:hypothetical protein
VGCSSKGASAIAIRLDEESGLMAMTLEDSIASGGGACAEANPQLKIKTRVRKKRVIFLLEFAKF